MLRSNCPSMEPCGIMKLISDHELYLPFNLTFCLRLVKYEFNSFEEGTAIPLA